MLQDVLNNRNSTIKKRKAKKWFLLGRTRRLSSSFLSDLYPLFSRGSDPDPQSCKTRIHSPAGLGTETLQGPDPNPCKTRFRSPACKYDDNA